MRRVGIFLLAVVALVAMAGPVSAQPKVTITGFVDNVTSWSKNVSNVDINLNRAKDAEWYSRTRVRPDITAEVGTTKFVLGLEIDETWGQTGNNTNSGVCGSTATNAASPNGSLAPAVAGTTGGSSCSSPQHVGATSGWGLNTDSQGVIEIKWAYTEFDVPLIPFPTRMRLGAQPFETQYKLAVLANGDFAGVHLTSQFVPMVKGNLTYVQIEESSTGPRDGFIRGDDFAIITSVEITPFKGLDLRPIYAYANLVGVTSGNTRTGKGGVVTNATVFQTCPAVAGAVGAAGTACGVGSASSIEDRHTVGLDARWRFGPFSFDPTVFYQFGNRMEVVPSFFTNQARNLSGIHTSMKEDAWFVDLRGGWQAGPLLLEAAAVYTTGNKATDRIDAGQSRIKYYQPIDNDSSYFAGGWASVWGLGIDYFNMMRGGAASGVSPGVSIGYDKYGLIRGAIRASYALTPAFTLSSAFNANWAAEKVDTASNLTAATGLIPRCSTVGFGVGASAVAGLTAAQAFNCVDRGTARYLGSELNLGFQWRFAPNVAFDLMGAYMWAGNALSTATSTNITTGIPSNGRNPQDVQSVAMRVRYSF